jgi:cancer susceptibility candidate protein 1
VIILPEYVFTTSKDEIKVGVWDDEQNLWSADYIEELAFDREKRELEFTTRKFAPIAFLQSKVTDFPYDSWYLRSVDNQKALLSIVTKRININIEIYPLHVRLVEMEQPELSHLLNKDMHIGILLFELSKCGIHLMPEDDDAKRGGIHLKDKGAEERAILDIAQTLKCFAFQSVK